jgi:hypothetical protein
VAASRWRWRGFAVGGSFWLIAGLLCVGGGVASASAKPEAGPPGGPRLSVSELYSVALPTGSWVPVEVTVSNPSASDLKADLVVTSPTAQLVSPGVQTCYSVKTFPGGHSFICSVAGGLSGISSGFSSNPVASLVTYRVPVDLAPGTTKHESVEVLLAGPAANAVNVEAQAASGATLAHASARLSVDAGAGQPAVLVLTDNPAATSSLPLPEPDGKQPQVQLLAPTQLPPSSAALAAFSAIFIDEADTTMLSPAQGAALAAYVGAGGTLAVAGGSAWRGDVAGLPPGLLPAAASGGTAAERLTTLSELFGVEPPAGKAVAQRLRPMRGAAVLLQDGATPLLVEAQKGSGQVLASALDPATAPLPGWRGDAYLTSWLLAASYQRGYYPPALGVATTPLASVALGGQAGATLLEAPLVGAALGSFVEQMPGAALPSAGFLGLLLLGYVAVVGPTSFFVLARLRKRELAWAVVPSVAVLAALAAYLTGAGMGVRPSVAEVQVADLPPGSHLAQVSSLGAVYLPRGGTDLVWLSGPAGVSDLGADAGATLAVSPGRAPGTSELHFSGANDTLGGWAASEDLDVRGTVRAAVGLYGSTFRGQVANELGTPLRDVYVASPSGALRKLPDLPAGSATRFSLEGSSGGPGGAAISTVVPGPALGTVANAIAAARLIARPGTEQAREEAAAAGLSELAQSYAAEAGTPVLVALAGRQFMPADSAGSVAPEKLSQVVLVPLPGAAGSPGANAKPAALAGEVMASRGILGESAPGNGSPASFVLAKGGSLYYQFLLHGSASKRLQLGFGSDDASDSALGGNQGNGLGVSPNGLATSGTKVASPRDIAVFAFDYLSGKWEPMAVSRRGGGIFAIAASLGPLTSSGALEVRLSARVGGLEVSGAVPTASLLPRGS